MRLRLCLVLLILLGQQAAAEPKRDIRDSTTGMEQSEVLEKLKALGLFCVKNHNELDCSQGTTRAFAFYFAENLPRPVVYTLFLQVNADRTFKEMIDVVSQQFGAQVKYDQHKLPYRNLDENDVLRLEIGTFSSYQLRLANEKIQQMDRQAREAKRLSTPPPKF